MSTERCYSLLSVYQFWRWASGAEHIPTGPSLWLRQKSAMQMEKWSFFYKSILVQAIVPLWNNASFFGNMIWRWHRSLFSLLRGNAGYSFMSVKAEKGKDGRFYLSYVGQFGLICQHMWCSVPLPSDKMLLQCSFVSILLIFYLDTTYHPFCHVATSSFKRFYWDFI